MSRGGSRPGAGRPRKDGMPLKSAPYKRPSRAKVKPKSVGGEPPVKAHSKAGVKAVDAPKDWPFGVLPAAAAPAAPVETPAEAVEEIEAVDPNLTPLDYLLQVVRNPKAAPSQRIQAANIAAPYMHVKKGEGGKKAEKDEAAKRATSKFTPAVAPLKLVNLAKK